MPQWCKGSFIRALCAGIFVGMADKLDKNQKRELAYQLYMNSSVTFKEVAERVGVQQKTLSRWAQEGGWQDEKAARSVTKPKLLQNFYQQILKTQEAAQEEDRPLTYQEADQLAKLANAVEKIEKDNLSTYVRVLEGYNNWLKDVDLELAQKNVEYMTEFLQKKHKELNDE